jgi:hypothetical protein
MKKHKDANRNQEFVIRDLHPLPNYFLCPRNLRLESDIRMQSLTFHSEIIKDFSKAPKRLLLKN